MFAENFGPPGPIISKNTVRPEIFGSDVVF